jgi:hypothetical protein
LQVRADGDEVVLGERCGQKGAIGGAAHGVRGVEGTLGGMEGQEGDRGAEWRGRRSSTMGSWPDRPSSERGPG